MLGQISILTLQEGSTLTTIPTRWLISGWRADDRDLHKNNKTQYFIIDKIKIICNNPGSSIINLIKIKSQNLLPIFILLFTCRAFESF
jgi:hypothetical protein